MCMQVHAARLRGGGKDVVLKVLKPRVEDTLLTDLNFLYLAGKFLQIISPDLERTSLVGIIEDIRNGRVRTVVNFNLNTLNIISCPSCSRVENEAFVDLAQDVKEMTEYAKDHAITIAVMGCRVNGPGETDDADLGLWCAPNYVNLKKGEESLGAYPYDEILGKLKEELDKLIASKA